LLGLYSYCIFGKIRESEELLLGEGIDPAFPVEVIGYKNIGAAVSKVPLSEFGEDALHYNISNNLKWVEDKARRHVLILEQISEQYSVAPLKFCTIFNKRERILKLLAQKYDELSHILERVQGKYEWTVKVFCNEETFIKHVENEKRQILESALEGKPPGITYLLKKKINENVKEASEKELTKRANNIYESLRTYSTDTALEGCLTKGMTGRSERMILNCSLLIPRENVEDFLIKINEANSLENPEGLFVEISGPWPPYSFTLFNLEDDHD
jgi:hypothetical protein